LNIADFVLGLPTRLAAAEPDQQRVEDPSASTWLTSGAEQAGDGQHGLRWEPYISAKDANGSARRSAARTSTRHPQRGHRTRPSVCCSRAIGFERQVERGTSGCSSRRAARSGIPKATTRRRFAWVAGSLRRAEALGDAHHALSTRRRQHGRRARAHVVPHDCPTRTAAAQLSDPWSATPGEIPRRRSATWANW
jgi:hypothetical protein